MQCFHLRFVAFRLLSDYVCRVFLRFSVRKMIINFSPFTVARMPSKAVSEIEGAKYVSISHVLVIL